MPKVQLEINAFPAHVRTARLIAAALGRRLGLDAVVIDEVKLAVGEACARAVSVHRTDKIPAPIVVQFRDDDDILEVSVLDSGRSGAQLPAFPGDDGAGGDLAADAAEAAAADLLRSAGGATDSAAELEHNLDVAILAPNLGLALIAGLVDDVSVRDRRDSTGTVVTMRWPIVSF